MGSYLVNERVYHVSTLWKVRCFNNLGELPTKYEGKTIILVTPEEFERVPDGTLFISINGEERIKGTDYIDNDTRGGHLAFGTLVEDD